MLLCSCFFAQRCLLIYLFPTFHCHQFFIHIPSKFPAKSLGAHQTVYDYTSGQFSFQAKWAIRWLLQVFCPLGGFLSTTVLKGCTSKGLLHYSIHFQVEPAIVQIICTPGLLLLFLCQLIKGFPVKPYVQEERKGCIARWGSSSFEILLYVTCAFRASQHDDEYIIEFVDGVQLCTHNFSCTCPSLWLEESDNTQLCWALPATW